MAQRQDELEPVTFAVSWPEIEPRVIHFLRRRGCDGPASEDLGQEVGLRLFKMWDRVDPATDVWPLVVTIALNLLRDKGNASARMRLVGQTPDLQDISNTEASALAKIELGRVARAMQLLNPRYRALLLDVIDDDRLPEDGAATRMARSRARTSLRAALEKVSAGVGGLGRRLWDRVRIVDTTGAATFSDMMLQTLVAAGVAISLGSGTSPVIEPTRNVLVATAARPDPAPELAVHRAFLGDLADPSAARVARSAPVRILSHETDTPPTWTPVSVNGQGVTMNQPDATAEVGGNGARVHVEDDAAGQHVESSPDATYTPPNCRVGADLEGPSTDCDEVKP